MRFKDIYSCIDKRDLIIPSKKEQEKLIAEMLLIFTSAKVLHYCWTELRKEYRIQVKMRPVNQLYFLLDELITCKTKIYVAIDRECIGENDTLFSTDIKTMINVLKKYYWELDEIYICSPDFKWFVSINHNYEFNVMGEKALNFFHNNKKRMASFIIDYHEYK